MSPAVLAINETLHCFTTYQYSFKNKVFGVSGSQMIGTSSIDLSVNSAVFFEENNFLGVS